MGSFLGSFFSFKSFLNVILGHLGSFWASLTPPAPPPESQFLGFGPTPAIPKTGPEKLRKFQFSQLWLGIVLEAETFTNRLSVQSYVTHAHQVFGLIFRLDEVMVRKPDV